MSCRTWWSARTDHVCVPARRHYRHQTLIAALLVSAALLATAVTPPLAGAIPAPEPVGAPAEAPPTTSPTERHSPPEGATPLKAPTLPPPTAGEIMAGTAYQFLGYPYIWAGNGPYGFDCSGFTQYIVLITRGIDIGHGIPGQTAAGYWVDWGAWQPGDLVFFANTYQAGLSHAGMYVGDGLFIHAQNEGTGVVLTSMYSGYYASRYYGAVRIP